MKCKPEIYTGAISSESGRTPCGGEPLGASALWAAEVWGQRSGGSPFTAANAGTTAHSGTLKGSLITAGRVRHFKQHTAQRANKRATVRLGGVDWTERWPCPPPQEVL